MSEQPFATHGDPATCEVPLLVHIPHAGTHIPPHVRDGILLGGAELRAEVVRVSDLHADRLYADALSLGGVAVVNHLSRLVVDPERFRDESSEPLSAKGAGAVYTRTTSGGTLREPSPSERESLLARYYDPYSAHIAALCDALLERFGAVLIVDCHTFGSRPVAWAADQDAERPEICIGTDDHHTPNALAQSLLGLCQHEGYLALRDKPYRGAYVPLKFYRTDPRVRSVLIEVRRDLYMDEATGEPSDRFQTTARLIDGLLQMCLTESRFITRDTLDPIEVVAYDPAWADRFSAVADKIGSVLGEVAQQIDHIGSTAVPGLYAKPVIDIQIQVSSLLEVDQYRPALESIGYRYMPHHSDVTRHYFRETQGPRTHIHVYPVGAEAALDNLMFRDHLRANPLARDRYSAIKREVVARFDGNRAIYTDAKQPVVLEIMREARAARDARA